MSDSIPSYPRSSAVWPRRKWVMCLSSSSSAWDGPPLQTTQPFRYSPSHSLPSDTSHLGIPPMPRSRRSAASRRSISPSKCKRVRCIGSHHGTIWFLSLWRYVGRWYFHIVQSIVQPLLRHIRLCGQRFLLPGPLARSRQQNWATIWSRGRRDVRQRHSG